jgi:hypothetical protein
MVALLMLCAVVILILAGTAIAKNIQNTSAKRPTPTQTTQLIPPQATCGTVNAREGTPPVVFNGQDAANAEACFWQVYQHCQAKRLVFHQMGVDTGVDNTLWPIKQKGKCYVADQVNYYSVSVPQGNRSALITCTNLRKTQEGLIVSGCGKNANLVVPAPTTTP